MMKLSKKLRKIARQMEESASIWDNDQTEGWDELADEAEGLEDHLEEVNGYLSYERSQVDKLKIALGMIIGIAPRIEELEDELKATYELLDVYEKENEGLRKYVIIMIEMQEKINKAMGEALDALKEGVR